MKTNWIVLSALTLLLNACAKEETAPATATNFSLVGTTAFTPSLSLRQSPQVACGGEGCVVGDPGSLKIRIYSISFSPNEDCSEYTTVWSSSAGKQVDFVASGTIYEGALAEGTYRCMILKMSDVLNYTSLSAGGENAVCATGMNYSQDIYKSGESDWVDADGVQVIGSGDNTTPVNDKVTLFFTNPTSGAAAVVERGASPNQIVAMSNDLVVPGTAVMGYIGTDSIKDGDGTRCTLDAGTVLFTSSTR